MALIKPRLNDYYNLPFTQEEVNFAIPFLDEDIPLYLDPFLLWKSPSQQDNALHTAIVNSFNHLGYLTNKGNENEAIKTLIKTSECYEVGLGDSRRRIGKPIGKELASEITSLFKNVPQINKSGFVHFEEAQLLVDQFSKDRVSDIACSYIKSFLIDFTIDQCNKLGIPMDKTKLEVYDYKKHVFVEEEVTLPQNPENRLPIILVPKRWLRFIPWLNYDDYFITSFAKEGRERVEILSYNRNNYGIVQTYIKYKELQQADCKSDPLFKPIPVLSVKRKLSTILKLPTGKTDRADKLYENYICQLMATLVYPRLDFADMQSRTDSGVQIRDLVFYNNRTYDFLKDIYDDYDCRQMVMELKNVKELQREHINQLNRYLSDQFGRFGIIITRNPPPKNIYQNTIALWSGQRRCILIIDDEDIKLMCQLYESRQRLPIDVLKRKFVEFMRDCPG
jgi:hypothetical protein